MPIEVNEKGELSVPVYENLRSEAMSEFISRRQGFLANWALLVFLLILVLLASASWFIYYPDVVVTRATIIAADKPREIITRQEGRLVKLFVHNAADVKAGTVLGFMESNAKHEQVLSLAQSLDSAITDVQDNNAANLGSRFITRNDSLGELQQGYQQFITALQQFESYTDNGYYVRKKQTLTDDIDWLQKSRGIIQQQKFLMEKDVKLSEEAYEMNLRLLKEKVISKQDDRNEQSKLLGKQLSIPQINAALLQNETQQRDKQKEIAELAYTISQQKFLIEQQLQTLQTQVSDWIKKYVLIAPVAGKTGYLLPLQENSFYPANKLLGYINPSASAYYAEINLPQNNFGKVETGQQVQLRFDAYPYAEFGQVKAKLGYVAAFATDSGFLAHLQLPDGLLTTQYKTLQYHSGLKAEARIVTKDMRLIERLYASIRQIVEK